ncbi:MAG: LPS-assembly protein LptD [Rickettsiales bacterium]
MNDTPPKHSTYRYGSFTVATLLLSFTSLHTVYAREVEPPPGSLESLVEEKQEFKRTDFNRDIPFSEDDPVLLTATQMDYDQQNNIVTATGNVEVTQGQTVLLADKLVYDQFNNQVKAIGNVSMMDASGSVVFAEEVQLKDDMHAGVIRQFKARLSDDSLFVAAQANKLDEDVTELTRAVYSPCKVTCDEDSVGHDPMWQLRASTVRVDEEEQLVTYDDVNFEVYGTPVFYTPYLSHATPGADNKSGLLAPEFQQNGNLGSVVKVPYYYVIGQDKDLTITPIYTSQEGLVMAGGYRQKFDNGEWFMDGSITRPQDRDGRGFVERGKNFRGHFNTNGKFAAGQDTDLGFDIHYTTDDTYLRRYDFGTETLLTSRVYAESYDLIGDNDRSFGSIEGISFQGLRASDNSDLIPVIAPLATMHYETDPGVYNSRFSLDANTMVLFRDIGSKSRRLSLTGAWKLPFITNDGQIIEFKTQLRGDVYSVEDYTLANSEVYDGSTGRLVPEVSLNWRYPFLNQWGNGHSVMIEPVVAMAVSPRGGNPEEIPNEDSLVPEFTDSNLFDSNRFSGYDRIESGPRVSYGMRGQAQLFSDKYIDWLFGQHYRVDTDRNFPFSNDLDDHFSDYVGKVGIAYLPFDVSYRFRLDKETLSAKRNEVDASFSYNPVTLTTAYLSLKNDPVLATREEIYGRAAVWLTDQWQWDVRGRRDLNLDQITSASTSLTFKNECTFFTGVLGKEYTRDRDVKPTTSFLFRIALKNLE